MTAQFQFFQSLPHKKADFVKKKPAEHGVIVKLLFLNVDFPVQSTGQLVTVRGCSSFDSQTFPVAWQKAMVGDYWEVNI